MTRHIPRTTSLPAITLLISGAFIHSTGIAQTIKSPANNRIVFKCTVDGTVVYSDNPCLGAQVLNVQPTRGLNKSTGKEVTGRDVMLEKNHEAFVNAVELLTGMDLNQFDEAKRRIYMTGKQKTECVQLDNDIVSAQSHEKVASKDALPGIQSNLVNMRTKYRGSGC